ncbi:hypothetical protein AOQ84DRAFT_437478 [Glonium stellatum]|uniref:Uncharacterized protein n=1 Tax=Glonium stellatum TaxID=574774 RepID=A0A8E2F7X4_9PEZI|nr:hypothetical protein AOQ84DRAFT_437478 [Glonium stellatum]
MDFRHRKEHPSLHYYALNHSDDDYYVTLAYVPKREPFGDPELSSDPLFLNLLEMWCCLMFRTLSKRYLIEFLPPDSEIKDRETEHLNIRLPLEQNTPPDWPMIQDVLRNSPDPLYKKYHLDGLMRYYRNDSVLLEYNRLIEKRCMELDKLSATHRYKSRIKKHRMDLGKPSAPSRGPPSPILPRLPLAGISQARRGPRVGDTNGVYAVTPASTVPRAVADSAKHYVGQDAAVNRSQTGYRTRIQRKAKRKWECVEETPSSPPRGQAVNRMYYLNSDYEQGEPSRGVKRATIQKSDSNEEWKGYCTDDLEISLSSLVL